MCALLDEELLLLQQRPQRSGKHKAVENNAAVSLVQPCCAMLSTVMAIVSSIGSLPLIRLYLLLLSQSMNSTAWDMPTGNPVLAWVCLLTKVQAYIHEKNWLDTHCLFCAANDAFVDKTSCVMFKACHTTT